MAIASQNIMATLRSMPDAQLAKYAAMHKNDPFIFPLAFQESQNRKHVRNAQQAQMAGQEQPKVVEQDLAQMMPEQAPAPAMDATQLPEDVGIAQLPAQNMQGMAGGGIVAFDNGGEVATSPAGEWWSGVTDWFGRVGDPATNPRARASELQAQRARAEQGIFEALTPSQKAERQAQVAALDAQIASLLNPKNTPTPATSPRAEGFKITSTEPTGNIMGSRRTPLELAKEAADKVDTGRKGGKDDVGIAKLMPAAPGAGKAAPAAAAEKGLGSIAEFAKEANAYTGDDPTAKQMARIEKQEAGAAGEKKDALNMALLKAGLGMMAGTSRYAFENIGKGAMAGAEEYGAAMKDLKKAALERDKMRDAAEQAAYAYKRDDVKGYRTAKEKEADRRTEMEKAQLAASTQLQAANIGRSATLAAAQLPPKEAQMAMMFAPTHGADGKPLSPEQRFQVGYPKLVEAQADKFSPAAAYAKYMNSYDENKTTRPFLSFPEFLQTFGYGGSAQPGKGATIRANPGMGG